MGELVGIIAIIIAALGGAVSIVVVPLSLGILAAAFLPVILPAAWASHQRELREWDEYRLERFGPVSE